MAQTCQLLSDMGVQDTSNFQQQGVTGGDLLELTDEELMQELHLSKLKVWCTVVACRVDADCACVLR